jgi:hypothetical protein
MNRSWFQQSTLNVTFASPNSDTLTKSIAKILLDLVRSYRNQAVGSEGPLQMLNAPKIRKVCAWLTDGRFGIVLQEEIRPFSEEQTLTLSNHL